MAVLSKEPMLGSRGAGCRFVELMGLGLAAGAFVLGLATGCNREDPRGVADARGPGPAEVSAPATNEPSTLPATSKGATRPVAQPASGATIPARVEKVEEEGTVVSLESVGGYRAGQPGEVRVVLEAQPPYKVNEEYPFRFQLEPSDSIDYARPVVNKDAMKLEKTRGTMGVALTPKKAGEHVVAGKFHYSVCTDDRCRFGKADLALRIAVK